MDKIEQAQLIAQYIKGIKQDKAELVTLLEKHKTKLPKADQAKVQEIKERKHGR